MRVLLGVRLHRRRRAAVGVALAQDRVHGRALDLVVAGADVALLVGGRVLRVVGQVVALLVQLGDRGLELRHRGADVRQLDDVGLGRRGQLAELGQGVGTRCCSVSRSGNWARMRPASEMSRSSTSTPAGGGERLDDRQQRLGRQRRRLVGVRVDDLHGHDAFAVPASSSLSSVSVVPP